MSGNVNDKIAKALADLEGLRHADRAAHDAGAYSAGRRRTSSSWIVHT